MAACPTGDAGPGLSLAENRDCGLGDGTIGLDTLFGHETEHCRIAARTIDRSVPVRGVTWRERETMLLGSMSSSKCCRLGKAPRIHHASGWVDSPATSQSLKYNAWDYMQDVVDDMISETRPFQ